MNYANIKYNDVANGIGCRTSLFVSGCPHHCKGCFNSIAWDYNYGDVFTVEVMHEIIRSLEPAYIEGLSVLGGEPLCYDNILNVLILCKEVKRTYPTKNIWVYTGYNYEELIDDHDNAVWFRSLLKYIDVLVDGKFEEDKKDISLRFKGSSNQRIIDIPNTVKNSKVTIWHGII